MQAAATYSVEHRLALFGGILLLGVAAAIVARRLRVPVLVLFLGLGMFMGSDGPGGIYFDDAELARGIGIVGLVAILFEGGLTSEWRSVRRVIVPALSLSSVGVIVTAAVVGRDGVRPLRPDLVRRAPARCDRRLDGRRGRLRGAAVHGAAAADREPARGRVGLQRPDGRCAHDRADLVGDRADLRRRGHRRPARPPVLARAPDRHRARDPGLVGAALDPGGPVRVRARRHGRHRRARLRRRRRGRRQRLPLRLRGRPLHRQSPHAVPALDRRLPRGARVRGAGGAVRRPRAARLSEPARLGRPGLARADRGPRPRRAAARSSRSRRRSCASAGRSASS